ncbi:MAG: helix-turn-helix transcriptional regulator [Ruminococcaceae bacterium]|nr:helix-turn-helix transcriptional regulator [Oscillospiraceae bacterium]
MSKDVEKCKHIEAYIDKHITEELTLDGIADKFGISKYCLCHLFKKNMGYTVFQYIRRKRLYLVKKYYAPGMNLINVSRLVGYKSYSNFYRDYYKAFGRPPSESIESIDICDE